MKMTINARNMVVTPAVTKRIEKKTFKMERYLLPETEVQIKMQKGKKDQRIVEITVPMGNNVILRSEAVADDNNLFLAIDQALAKIERQIHRHRTKLGKRLREDAFVPEVPEYIDEEPAEENAPKIVRHKTFPVRPMSVEDAAIQMEMLGHSFFIYTDFDTDAISVVYKRKDGGYGCIETE